MSRCWRRAARLCAGPADMAIPDQLSPTRTVCLDAHAGPDGADAAAPAGRQISAPGCSTASALASFASSRVAKDTSADREIPNQLSPFTTVCLDAHEASSEVGAGRGAPSGTHSASPGCSTVEASASFAPSKAPAVTPAAVATENQASPSTTVYVAGAGDEAVGAQTRRIERPAASAGNAGAMKVIAMPARAASVNRPARRPKARWTVVEMCGVRFMAMSPPPRREPYQRTVDRSGRRTVGNVLVVAALGHHLRGAPEACAMSSSPASASSCRTHWPGVGTWAGKVVPNEAAPGALTIPLQHPLHRERSTASLSALPHIA